MADEQAATEEAASAPEGANPAPHKGGFVHSLSQHKLMVVGVTIAALTLLLGIAAYRRQQSANASRPTIDASGATNAQAQPGSEYQSWQWAAMANQLGSIASQLNTIEQAAQHPPAASHGTTNGRQAPPPAPVHPWTSGRGVPTQSAPSAMNER